MNKTEFIEAIAKELGATKADVARFLVAEQSVIAKTLKKGKSIQLVGFGTYSVVKRAARKGHNPMTGKEIKIPACKAPKFKPGKGLKDALN